MRNRTYSLTIAGICLSLCLLLPFVTGQIPRFGQMLSPMHLPVLLCGLVCGPLYGAAVGAVAPLLRSLLFSMPPLFPTATAMVFELAVYGLVAGLLRRLLPKKRGCLLLALVGAMLTGRLVGGLAQFLFVVFGLTETYSLSLFLAAYVTSALPGIVLQLILLPPLTVLLERQGIARTVKKKK